MSTLNVNTINAATSGQAVAVDVKNPRSFRNLIINGDMRIAQRGTTSNAEDGYLHVDRWRVSCGSDGADITTSQDTDSPADFVNSLKYTCTSAAGSATNSSDFDQFIEGQNIAHLNWGTSDAKAVTLSFWAKCSVANIVLGGCLRNSAFNMTYPFTYTTNGTANTWTKYTITIPGPTSGTWLTTNGLGIAVTFNLGSAAGRLATANTWANSVARGPTGASSLTTVVNSTFFLTGVQLEEGSYATDFEHRSYADELQRCKRYYVKYGRWMGGTRGSSTSRSWTLDFGMRLTGSDVSNGTYTNDGTSSGDVVYTGSSATRNVSNVSANTLGASSNSTENQLSVGLEVGHSIGSGDNGIVTGLYLNGFTIDHEI